MANITTAFRKKRGDFHGQALEACNDSRSNSLISLERRDLNPVFLGTSCQVSLLDRITHFFLKLLAKIPQLIPLEN